MADPWAEGAVTAKDVALHKTICGRPVPAGLSWQTPCSCKCSMHRHDRLEHSRIFNRTRTVLCSGRLNFGPCRNCPCAGFKPQPATQEATR